MDNVVAIFTVEEGYVIHDVVNEVRFVVNFDVDGDGHYNLTFKVAFYIFNVFWF